MKEPRRLLTDTATSTLERSLLAAGRARREPESARERVWSALAVGAAASGAATLSSTGSTAAGASAGAKGVGAALALTNVKLLVGFAVIVTAGSVAAVVARHDEPVPVAMVETAGAGVAAAPPAPAVKGASAQSGMKVEAKAKPEANVNAPAKLSAFAPRTITTARAEDAPARRVVVSDLREEVSLLEEVRAALRRGDAADARAKLDDVRMRFPESKLVQERDALDVRVASASGDHARAVSLARAFVEQYPDSPFRAGVESLVDAPRK